MRMNISVLSRVCVCVCVDEVTHVHVCVVQLLISLTDIDVTVQSSVFRRSRPNILTQYLALTNVSAWNVANKPVSPLSPLRICP